MGVQCVFSYSGYFMASILIGYDLNKSGQNYNELIEVIKALADNWWHCLDSTWIIKTNKSCAQVRDDLKGHVDTNDELLVIKLTGEGAWVGFNDECSSWLKNNL